MNGAHVGIFFCHIVLLFLMIPSLMNCTNFGGFPPFFVVCGGIDDCTFCELCQLWGLFSFCCCVGFM